MRDKNYQGSKYSWNVKQKQEKETQLKCKSEHKLPEGQKIGMEVEGPGL